MIPTELHRFPPNGRPPPRIVRARPDELAAWRAQRRRHKRRADRVLRALFAVLFLMGAVGGFGVALVAIR